MLRKPCGAMEAHQTSNLGVLGSSPSRVDKFFYFLRQSKKEKSFLFKKDFLNKNCFDYIIDKLFISEAFIKAKNT